MGEVVPSGSVLTIVRWSGEEREFDGPFSVLKDIDVDELKRQFIEERSAEGLRFATASWFVRWLQEKGYMRSLSNSHEMHIGNELYW